MVVRDQVPIHQEAGAGRDPVSRLHEIDVNDARANSIEKIR
jgi:hypothetical protein